MTTRQEEGRAEILERAAAFIAEHGYHGMSMRDLAKATGRGLASLYNYFDSKEELLFALQLGAFHRLIESARAAMAVADEPAARLYAFILNHVHYVSEHPAVMRVLVHEASALPAPERRKIRHLKEQYFSLARDVIEELARGSIRPSSRQARLVPADEVERMTYTVFGMINWVYGWYRPHAHGGAHEVARTIYAVAMGGLAGPRASRAWMDDLDGHVEAHAGESLLRKGTAA